MVASAGGHLDELMILADSIDVPTSEVVWATSRSAHTESVLRDRSVVWLPHIGSGEKMKALRALPAALRLQRRLRPDLVVSTGALIAVPHLLAARIRGCETWFIDSATRVHGPSLTGKFAERFTRARLFMQRPGWGDPRWTAIPGVFDAFVPLPERRVGRLMKVVVSLGSERWPFERAVSRILELLPNADITWQTGVTEYEVGGSPLRQWVPAADLRAEMASADLVITHAGVGSVLACLECGKVPVILPRSAARGEHVDDHQLEFAELVDARGLAVSADADRLTLTDFRRAAGRRVERSD